MMIRRHSRSRLLAASLAGVLSVSCLAACSSPANDRETRTASALPTSPSGSSASSNAGLTPLGTASLEDKTAHQSNDAQLIVTNVRVGDHDTFDRVVFDLEGTGTPGWFIETTTSPLQQGRGSVVKYSGDVALNVNIDGTVYPFELGREDPPLGVFPGTKNIITEVNALGTFEGRSQFIVGLKGQGHPYSVQVLTEPTRLVIDILKG